mgnify:CR=1 FL=1
MFGYKPCAICGAETNVVDLTAGVCQECKAELAVELSSLQRRYDAAMLDGDHGAAAGAVDAIETFQERWGLRLTAAPTVAQMRKAAGDPLASL